MVTPLMTKADWRRAWRARRTQEMGDTKALGREVLGYLSTQSVQCLGLFVPMEGEPALWDEFLAWAQERGIAVALPYTDKSMRAMTYRAYRRGAVLEPDTAGILAPVETIQVEPDWLVVPCVGFHPSGRRLGYGGGYFDRYLASHPTTRTIGLAWHWSMVPETVFESWDVPLTAIVTDRGRFVSR